MKGKWIGPGNLKLGSELLAPGSPVEMPDKLYLQLIEDKHAGHDRSAKFADVIMDVPLPPKMPKDEPKGKSKGK